MGDIKIEDFNIMRGFKELTKLIARNRQIKHSKALDFTAKKMGFRNYREFKIFCDNNGGNDPERFLKVGKKIMASLDGLKKQLAA